LIVAMSRAVPITGSAAFIPGKAVLSLKIKALLITSAKPINPTNFLVLTGGTRTKRAPKPSSQALVGSE
jgi:hypothetical protein